MNVFNKAPCNTGSGGRTPHILDFGNKRNMSGQLHVAAASPLGENSQFIIE